MLTISRIIVDTGPNVLIIFAIIGLLLFAMWRFVPLDGHYLALVRITVMGIILAFAIIVIFDDYFQI